MAEAKVKQSLPDELSDEEIQALERDSMPDELSDDDMAKLEASQPEKGFLESYVLPPLEYIDRFTGAPARQALSVGLEKGPLEGISAGLSQFGAPTEGVPSGKDIAMKTGVSDEDLMRKYWASEGASPESLEGQPSLSAADIAGLGIEIGADITNLIPMAGALKKGAQALKGASKASEVSKPVMQVGKEGASRISGPSATLISETVPIAPKEDGWLKASYKDIANALSESVNPKFRAQYAKDVELSLENGINPTLLPSAVKYGKETYLAKTEQVRMQGPGGEKASSKFLEGRQQVRDAIDRKVVQISNGAAPLDDVGAGNAIREGYNTAVDDLFQKNDVRYRTISENNPDLKIPQSVGYDLATGIQELRNEVEQQLMFAPSRAEKARNEEALYALDRITENLKSVGHTAGGRSFKNLVNQLQAVGRVAFKEVEPIVGMAQIDKKLMKDVYELLQNATIDSVGALDKGLKSDLVKSNQEMSKFFKTQEPIIKAIQNANVSPEKVFQQIVKSGDSTRISAIKELLKDQPQVLNSLKASFLDGLKVFDQEGNFSFARMNSTILNDDKVQRVFKTLFDEKEIKQFKDLVRLGADFGEMKLNSSGTAVFGAMSKPDEFVYNMMKMRKLEDTLKGRAKFPEGAPLQEAQAVKQQAESMYPQMDMTLVFGKQIDIPPNMRPTVAEKIKSMPGGMAKKAKLISDMAKTGRLLIDPELFQGFASEPEPTPSPSPSPFVEGMESGALKKSKDPMDWTKKRNIKQ